MHQGTHSPDAFTNNMHEVVYHIRCSDGTGFGATLLTHIGTPGELVVGCDRQRHVVAGVATPSISPGGGGKRALPEVACLQERVLGGERPNFDAALRESWEISASLRTSSGRTLVSFNPYFQAMDPSRYFDATAPRQMARPIDLCYTDAVRGRDRCEGLPAGPIGWDDKADKNVENIAVQLESEPIARHYPRHANRKVSKYGTSRGWRRNRLRTAGGFTIDAVGLDTAARGLKVEERRPDLIVLDDVDGKHDTLTTTAKKIATITTSILPAGSTNVAVLFVQNLIIRDGVASRIADGRARYSRMASVGGSPGADRSGAPSPGQVQARS